MQECYEYKYETANFLDYSKVDLIPYNDTDVYVNGSLFAARDISSPWKKIFILSNKFKDNGYFKLSIALMMIFAFLW